MVRSLVSWWFTAVFVLDSCHSFHIGHHAQSYDTKRFRSYQYPETIETTETNNNDPMIHNGVEDDSSMIWKSLAFRATQCLYHSDLRRDGQAEGTQASSATNWIHDATAFTLQKTVDQISLQMPRNDAAMAWMRWVQSIPSPAIVELSREFASQVNDSLTDRMLDVIDQTREEFLSRIAFRLILLPSGETLNRLNEPPASVVYGKLLFGGATRYRIVADRPTGSRTEVKATRQAQSPVWMMFGGADRCYDAVDMGAAAIIELILLPRSKTLEQPQILYDHCMQIHGMPWDPIDMFEFQPLSDSRHDEAEEDTTYQYSSASSMSGKAKNDAFRSDFRSAVGGLQPQIDTIIRRVLDGRVLRPVDDDDQDSMMSTTVAEAKELQLLGLSPVRGLLLYGPPG